MKFAAASLVLPISAAADSVDCLAGPIAYSKCFGPSFGPGGNPKCFNEKITFNFCCNFYWWGAGGNPACWDELHTYGRCCGTTSHAPNNARLVKKMEEMYKAWKATPTFHNLHMLWLSIGRHKLFATRRIHVPQLIPAFYYMFPMEDHDQQHLLLDFITQGVHDKDFMALEPRVTYQLARRMRQCCRQGGHFLDVGGNFGWYTLLAAALGCEEGFVGEFPCLWRVQIEVFFDSVY